MTTPNLTSKQLDTIARFGFDRPPATDELGAGARAPLDLDAIEARALSTDTPGPWEERTEGHREPWTVCHDSEMVFFLGFDTVAEFTQRDAEFIACARQDVPALVAEVRRLNGIIDHLRAGGSIPPAVTS